MSNQYQEFWSWFEEKSEYIFQHLQTDTDNIVFELNEKLHEIHHELAFEIPWEIEAGYRTLIISADGLIELFDTVINIVENAPNIPQWNIVAFRPRLHQRNQIIDLADISLDYHDVFFTYQESSEGLDLSVYIKGYDHEDNRYVHLYFLLLDSLIGEFDAVTLIRKTDVLPLVSLDNLIPFPELINIIDHYKNKKMT